MEWDYARVHSGQEQEEEKGATIVVTKDSKKKIIMANVVPSKEVENYAAEVVKMNEQMGYQKAMLRSGSGRRVCH